ncbi:HIT domain-containing protein [Candidatus Poribacteria bacterium]|nr:HIT domain-containing protein [Candidatus Poribacteria bacterium]
MRQLYIPSKMSYVKGKRPQVDCILCAVCHKDRKVTKLEVHRTKHWVVSANLHPYTAGHMLLFPCRHIADVRQLLENEVSEMIAVQKLCLDVLDAAYKPAGYNIGFNIGRPAGASIEHLHLHIVPRYPNEAGFLDILSETRSIVESPKQTVKTLRAHFKKLSKGGS